MSLFQAYFSNNHQKQAASSEMKKELSKKSFSKNQESILLLNKVIKLYNWTVLLIYKGIKCKK